MIVADSPGIKPMFDFLFVNTQSSVGTTRTESVRVQDPIDELGGSDGSLRYKAHDYDAV